MVEALQAQARFCDELACACIDQRTILLAILRALSDLILIKPPSDPLWFDLEDRTGGGNAEVNYRCGFHTGRFR